MKVVKTKKLKKNLLWISLVVFVVVNYAINLGNESYYVVQNITAASAIAFITLMFEHSVLKNINK